MFWCDQQYEKLKVEQNVYNENWSVAFKAVFTIETMHMSVCDSAMTRGQFYKIWCFRCDQQCEKLKVEQNVYNEIATSHSRQCFQIDCFVCFFQPSATTVLILPRIQRHRILSSCFKGCHLLLYVHFLRFLFICQSFFVISVHFPFFPVLSCSFIFCRFRPSAKAVSTVGPMAIRTLHANDLISNAKSWRLNRRCTTKLERRIERSFPD